MNDSEQGEEPQAVQIKMDRQVSYQEKSQSIEDSGSYQNGDSNNGPVSQPPITFADLGIPTGPQLNDVVVGVGKVRAFSEISWKERLYVTFMLMAILSVMAFTVYRVATVSQANSDFVFGLVLIVNAACCGVMVVDGVLRERPSELLILSIATGIIVIYLIVNFVAGTQGDIKLARLVVGCVFSPVLICVGLNIAWEYHMSGHLIFRTVGANELLQNIYRRLLFLQDLLKLDVQLGASMIILIVVSRLSVGLRDIIILSVGGVFTIAWFCLGFLSFPRESKVCAVLFFVFSPAEIGYICYKMYDVSYYIDSNPGLAGATIACGVLALLVRFVVIGVAMWVYRCFGNGLKEKIFR